MAFAPGDVVILKSGGQALTVVAVEEDTVECLWMGDDGELHRETVPTVALAAIDSEDEHEDEKEDEEQDEDEEDAEDDDE